MGGSEDLFYRVGVNLTVKVEATRGVSNESVGSVHIDLHAQSFLEPTRFIRRRGGKNTALALVYDGFYMIGSEGHPVD